MRTAQYIVLSDVVIPKDCLAIIVGYLSSPKMAVYVLYDFSASGRSPEVSIMLNPPLLNPFCLANISINLADSYIE
jgi:hypothetical protein